MVIVHNLLTPTTRPPFGLLPHPTFASNLKITEKNVNI
jgi:hypothetical protein